MADYNYGQFSTAEVPWNVHCLTWKQFELRHTVSVAQEYARKKGSVA